MIIIPNKNYKRGFGAEVRALNDLRKWGYWAQRAYGSKGAYDVVAVGHGEVHFIEVKRSLSKVVSPVSVAHKYSDSIEALCAIPDQPKTYKEIWLWTDKQGVAHGKGHQPAGWRMFTITNTHDGVNGIFIEEAVNYEHG